ncbi:MULTISPECIES: hypothetical protein [Paenibacillus]|uniref:hypothetical protein n=1 Tax=Paenibacillus TaxID=44249 RepID=UPI00096F2B55|nr:hypothetical protein [Paenibacillus odorifer]OME13980.1 hypothetical protein BSK60_14090 [Paenibacillus odorifer]
MIPTHVYLEKFGLHGIVRISTRSWTTGNRPIENDRTEEFVVAKRGKQTLRLTVNSLLQGDGQRDSWAKEESLSKDAYEEMVREHGIVDNDLFYHHWNGREQLKKDLQAAVERRSLVVTSAIPSWKLRQGGTVIFGVASDFRTLAWEARI